MAKRSLISLNKGETSVILSIVDQDISHKLLEMGCLPGRRITLDNRAPFGGPLCFRIEGSSSLALRAEEAACIEIE